MRSLIVILTISLVFFACDPPVKEIPIKSARSSYVVTAIDIETVRLSPEAFSGDGFFRTENDQILFFDYITSSVSTFDTEGNFMNQSLGIGEGPNEIPLAFVWHDLLQNGDHLFLGRVSNVHYYDANFIRKEHFTFERPKSRTVYKGYSEHELGMYGFDLILGSGAGASNNLAVDKNERLYLPVRILDRKSPNFNFYTKDYYQKSYTVGIVDTKSGGFKEAFGQWPAKYHDKVMPHMDNRFVVIKDDSVYVSYNASPHIQVYSPYPDLELQYSFGVEGEDIRNDYRSVRSRQENSEYTSEQGFYTHMHYDDASNRIFRSYFKDGQYDSKSGLQIYEDGVLIADVETPKHFNVIGKIGGHYYADGNQDEENDILEVYRFKF